MEKDDTITPTRSSPTVMQNGEGEEESEMMHFASVNSLRDAVVQHRRDAPPHPLGGSTVPGILSPQWKDAAAVAKVYRWWTGEGCAPWASPGEDERSSASQGTRERRAYHKRNAVRYKVNPLTRFHIDVHFAIERAHLLGRPPTRRDEVVEFLPFCGKVNASVCGPNMGSSAPSLAAAAGRKRGRDRTQDDQNAAQLGGGAIRILLVFWAPSYLAAKQQSTSIPSTSEALAIAFLERFLSAYRVSARISVAYVLPRYASTPFAARQSAPSRLRAHRDRFAETPPPVLAYGTWQLGVNVAFLRPHVILPTCAASARVVGCTGGLDISCFASEETKAMVAQQSPPRVYGSLAALSTDSPPLVPTASPNGTPSPPDPNVELPPTIPTVRRTLQHLLSPSAPPRTLRHPDQRLTSRGGGTHLYLLRVPHPIQIRRKMLTGGDSKVLAHNQTNFTKAMHAIARIARESTTTPDVPPQQQQQQHRRQYHAFFQPPILPLSRQAPQTLQRAEEAAPPPRKRARTTRATNRADDRRVEEIEDSDG